MVGRILNTVDQWFGWALLWLVVFIAVLVVLGFVSALLG
jgi:hypothetical protein